MAKKSKGKGKYYKCISSRMKKANFTRKQAAKSCSASMKGGKGGKGGKGAGTSKCAYSAKSGRCHLRQK